MNWITIVLTGLTTGGLSCLAVQGGLLASVIANQKDEELVDVGKQTSSKKKAVSPTVVPWACTPEY